MPGTVVPPAAALDVTIAGVRLAFRAGAGLGLAAPGFEYPPFLGGGAKVERSVELRIERGPMPALPRGARLAFDTGDGWQLFAAGARRWLRMPDRGRGGGACLWQAVWEAPLARAQIQAGAALMRGATVAHLLQYPLDQILLTQALLPAGGLLLHAAGADTPAGGMVFAGVSGAGKSTLTRMLDGRRGFLFASDDRVVVRPQRGGGLALHGTPWAGDAGVARALRAPLAALCFLRKSPRPGLVRLRPADALGRLLAVTTVPWYDAAGTGTALAACERLLARVPAFELAFDRDAPDAVADALCGLARAA